MIPKQLQQATFIKLQHNSKEPEGKNWKTLTLQEAQQHKGNIAVLCKPFTVIDIDDKHLADGFIQREFSDTFCVITRSGGLHAYYNIQKIIRGVNIYLKQKEHKGEIRHGNQYVLIPPSQINEQKYKTFNNKPIATITYKELQEKLSGFTFENPTKPKEENIVEALQPTNDRFQHFLKKDQRLRDLYNTPLNKGARSEAEFTLILKLIYYGFNETEIDNIMNGAATGRWRNAPKSYKQLTYKNAMRCSR